jgi:hypothetical protein
MITTNKILGTKTLGFEVKVKELAQFCLRSSSSKNTEDSAV